ncbi:muconate/chloromuconate family cycloisomerase [Pulveribacter sp.]|uniref:muconate/chloromuconate family cycloisomerase n=1 Tax=Pulveribacter sp. TaxID=2678893 RepID=UPI0028A9C0B1|nr:muconate/chloromuconate family cycloisomerase [Pulveribacter sp.]
MKIERITSTIVDLRLQRTHRLAMATMARHTLVVVQVHTDDGPTGLGEMSVIAGYDAMAAGAAKAVIDEVLAPVLLGQDPRRLWHAIGLMDRAIKGNLPCKAALEMACVDITARALGVSAAALFGGAVRDRLEMVWVLASGDLEQEVQEAREKLDQRTHRHFLVKIGTGDPRANVERAVALREALPEAATVRVDVNQAWDEATARWAIPALHAGGIAVVEQPVHASAIDAMRRLAQCSLLTVMADEAVATSQEAMAYAGTHACDALSIKVSKHGGLLRTQQIAHMAAAGGLALFGGTMIEGAIGTSACAQLYSTLPDLQWGCQLFGPQLMVDDVATSGLRYEDFTLRVPHGPGFGATLDPDRLAYHQRRAHAGP